MREREIEQKLVQWVRAKGGKCYKWNSPSNRGVADRILIFPGGHICFVELKTKDGRATALQERFSRTMEELGVYSPIIYGMEGLEALESDLEARYGV